MNMVRARQKLVAVVAALCGLSAARAEAGEGPVSPSKVLAQMSGKTGTAYVSFPSAYNRVAPPETDRSLAPYLMVLGEGHDGTERVPLKETSAEVSIAGVIARVQVRQLFENSGAKPIEAVYVFPASTRAAVHGVRMKIGDRVIEAKIDRRAAARATYEAARREGKRASLLEQERPNVFTMNVANIMPGDRIAVEMDYSEMLVPEDATYEFVYPTVVGPRYAGGADPGKDKWMANPHLGAGTPEPYRFDIKVHLETGIGIKELASPSHQVTVNYASANRADVKLAGAGGGNRDFVLRYRLAGDKIESGLLLWQGNGPHPENFFALMMEPPQRPTAQQIPAREYIFLLDVSGSMHGFPLDTAKVLMRGLLERLRPTDYFNIVQFSGAAHVMSPQGSVPAGKSEVGAAIAEVDRAQGGGGTELMGGLELSYKIPKPKAGISRTVVVVTDGFVGVEAQAFRYIRERLADANLFAFGIGSSVNRGLIEGMARAGQGEPFIVLRPEKAAAEAEKLRAYIEQPVLAGVKIAFQGFDAYDTAPQQLPDLMARRPLVLFGKYRGAPGGRIVVTGTTGSGRLQQAVDVRAADVRGENGALRWLWARKWVDTLEDERAMGAGKPAEEAITGLGLTYNLLTAFTSFVAVDSQVVNAGGDGKTVRQPLPMPEGVSNLAVANEGTIGLMNLQRHKGSGYGYGAGEQGKAGKPAAAPTARVAAEDAEDVLGGLVGPGSGSFASRDKAAKKETKASDGSATSAQSAPSQPWQITVGSFTSVTAPAALVASLRAALSRGGCPLPSKAVRLRLTIDGQGKVQKVVLVAGDRAVEACLARLLTGLASATVAHGAPTGTVEVTLTR
jgi:Ca-activated chloride channel family protein